MYRNHKSLHLFAIYQEMYVGHADLAQPLHIHMSLVKIVSHLGISIRVTQKNSKSSMRCRHITLCFPGKNSATFQ